MVEAGQEHGLAEEAHAEPFVRGELGRKKLERDVPLETLIKGAKDDSHAAAPDQFLEAIPEQLAPDAGIS